MFDVSKLLKIMEQKGITHKAMAARLGITRESFRLKVKRCLSGKKSFYVEEIILMIEILDIKEPWKELFDKNKVAGSE